MGLRDPLCPARQRLLRRLHEESHLLSPPALARSHLNAPHVGPQRQPRTPLCLNCHLGVCVSHGRSHRPKQKSHPVAAVETALFLDSEGIPHVLG